MDEEKEVKTESVEYMRGELKSARTRLIVATILLVITMVVALVMSNLSDKHLDELNITQAKLAECHQAQDKFDKQDGALIASLASYAIHGPICKDCPDCPPPPACPNPLDEQMKTQAQACTDQLAQIQQRWDAKFRLAQEAIDNAKKLGVGPTLRNWIANSQAQIASREVFLSFQDWTDVDIERSKFAQQCRGSLFDILGKMDVVKSYDALTDWQRGDRRLWNQLDQMYPHYIQWNIMEMQLSREAVGCKDDPDETRGHR